MNNSFFRTSFWLTVLVLSTYPAALFGKVQEKGGEANQLAVNAKAESPQIEVCFVLDTTGSMGGLIQGAKDKIWSIANELVTAKPTPQLKFGLIGYRDRGDTYVTKLTDLTADLDEIHSQLMAFAAAGGGDEPESVNQALNESVNKITWSDGREVLKIIFLVGDAPPKMGYDEVKYPAICKAAMEKNLIINTIQCGSTPHTRDVWKEIATKGEGSYTAILQSGGTVAIKTPFDDKISKLNVKLNRTVVCYGDEQVQLDNREKLASNEASNQEAIADRANFYSRSRIADKAGGGRFGKVIGGHEDLVEQLMNGEADLDKIDKSQLPPELRELTIEEQKAAIEQKVADRKALQKEMDALVKKRTDYIATEKKKLAAAGEADSFDAQVKEMIRVQGETRGINFENGK